MTSVVTAGRQAVLRRRIRLLVAATITYNVVEAVIALTAGTISSSIALIGFGLDSVIEVASAAAVAWQFAGADPQRRERAALRIIAWSFFTLAAYVTVEAVRTLVGAGEAERSTVGIVLVAISVVVMPFLSLAQRRAGRELRSASAVADSKQTLLCTYLSAAVLVGLVLDAALGWWWADPVVGLLITVAILGVLRSALTQVGARLMDAVDPALVDAATAAVARVDGVRGVRDLRVRWIGHTLRAEADITVDDDLTLDQAHELAHHAERHLLADVRRLSAATIHVSPVGAHR
jgi:cation diffusion facilitator family transporter